MKIIRNTFITICIALLGMLWIHLHSQEEQLAFELDNSQLAAGNLIALVVSKTGHGHEVGEAVEHGVRHYLSELSSQRNLEQIGLVVFDDKSDPLEAQRIAESISQDSRFITVIGHTDNDTAYSAAPIYEDAGISMITPTATAHEITQDNPWAFSTIMTDAEQGEFILFYVKHAMEGKRIVLLAHESNLSSALIEAFNVTAKTEGLEVADYTVPDHEGRLESSEKAELVSRIKSVQPDVVFLSLSAAHTEEMLVAIKDAGYRKRIFANGPVGTPYFARRFENLPKEQESPGYYTNNMIVPVPFILDIANELAHKENVLYHDEYAHDMSWPYAFGYDAAKSVTEAIHRAQKSIDLEKEDNRADRKAIRDELAAMDHADRGVVGITGPVFFSKTGGGLHPPIFGSFRARTLISDLNQFASNAMALEHYDPLEHTSHLMIHDQVFGLSDVVYTGIKFHHLQSVNVEERSVYADFELWFRYHGDFDPADIVFDNGAEGTLKTELIDEHKVKLTKYKKLRVKGSFYFQLAPVDFLQQKVDLIFSFKHRDMNRNELIYVVDRSAYNTNQFNLPLITQMTTDGVLHESEEAVLGEALIFEDILTKRAFGDPVFIDGKLPFSHFNAEIRLHQKGLSIPRQIGRILSHETVLTTFFCFAILFLITSYTFVTSRFGKKFVIFRYLLMAGVLMGMELLIFTGGANDLNVKLGTLELMVKVLDSIWYLFIAFFAHLLITHYLWPRVEKNTGYPVPAIARTLVSIVIFVVAATLIYAVVFGLSIVSIVATSGAITVVLGFALRELIMDFFAGIILNVERPFNINHFVSFHVGRGQHVQGLVQEMNWRTVRVKDEFGNMVVLPNSKISVEHLNNMSVAKFVEWKMHVYVKPEYQPEQIKPLLEQAVLDNPYIIGYGDPDIAPTIHLRGLENVAGTWVTHYRIKFAILHMGKGIEASESVWRKIFSLFHKAGFELEPAISS